MVLVSRPRSSSTDSRWNYFGVSVCGSENGPRFEASAVRLFPPRPWRLLSPWPLLCSSSMPVPRPSLLPQLPSASSTASVLLKLLLLLQLSLLSLCFLLCLFLCFSPPVHPRSSPPHTQDASEAPRMPQEASGGPSRLQGGFRRPHEASGRLQEASGSP